MSITEKVTSGLFRFSEMFRKKGPNLGYAPMEGKFLHVMMDVVERCNLRCTHCAFVYWRDEILSGDVMSDEVLARIDAEVFPHAKRVSLSCFHEPLIVPNRLFKAIDACKRNGVPAIDFITNGLLFTERMAAEVMERGTTRIYFSVDGASPETYDKVRVGGKFEKFIERMAMVGRVRDEVAARTGHRTSLSFICTMMRSNVHEAPTLVDLAADHGIDIVELRYLAKSDAAVVDEKELLCYAQDEADAAFDAAVERAAERGVELELMPDRFRDMRDRSDAVTAAPFHFRNCEFPWNTVVVAPSGDLYPCCLWHGNDALDQLRTKSFQKVWDGVAMRTLRRELATGRLSRQGCQDCIVHRDMADPEYWRTYHFRG